MANKKHIHKYYRMPFADGYVWACGLPGCNHHIPRYMESAIRQKATICWKCENEFFFVDNLLALDMSNPVCIECAPDSIAKTIIVASSEDTSFPGRITKDEKETKDIDMGKWLKDNGIVVPNKR